jgi:hypothetical protein
MKILKCIICKGEVELVSEDRSTNKKVRCSKCGFTNCTTTTNVKEPEILVIRRRKFIGD